MHRSRLAALIIDCQTDDLGSAAEFWSQALGYHEKRSTDPADDNYVLLETARITYILICRMSNIQSSTH